jgi:hypothetical protein
MGDTPAVILQQLLAVCHDAQRGALRLAHRTDVATMQAFLQDCSVQYRCAADELLAALREEGAATVQAELRRGDLPDIDGHEVAAAWERVEGAALTYFRDAVDGLPPSALADTVKRHYVDGVLRLERLRQLQFDEVV